jgi:hypothetical protein
MEKFLILSAERRNEPVAIGWVKIGRPVTARIAHLSLISRRHWSPSDKSADQSNLSA